MEVAAASMVAEGLAVVPEAAALGLVVAVEKVVREVEEAPQVAKVAALMATECLDQ